MRTVQIVLDERLVSAVDDAANKQQVNRSAFIRFALERCLKDLEIEELDRKEQAGYERFPDTEPDLKDWQKVVSWPVTE